MSEGLRVMSARTASMSSRQMASASCTAWTRRVQLDAPYERASASCASASFASSPRARISWRKSFAWRWSCPGSGRTGKRWTDITTSSNEPVVRWRRARRFGHYVRTLSRSAQVDSVLPADGRRPARPTNLTGHARGGVKWYHPRVTEERTVNRRTLFKTLAVAPAATVLPSLPAIGTTAGLPTAKVTRVRIFRPPNLNPLFNQSDMVVTVETDAGITGIGEGGAKDTLEQCAGRLIGQDPQHIEHLWQDMSRAFFYPPGREKEDALGALDLALWDIRGKALNLPVHAILGGTVRNYCECYNTAGIIPGIQRGMGIKERAHLTMEAGYRAFRMDAAGVRGSTYNTHERVNQVYQDCVEAREGVGKNGDFCIDFHQRFDLSDAIRGCDLIRD